MKHVCALILALMPFVVMSQSVYSASSEPLATYHDINKALSADDTKQALRLFDKIIAYYESSGENAMLADSYFGMALALALNGDYRHSIRYHKKAIKAHHKFKQGEPIEMSINLGLTYQLAGKQRKAKRILGADFISS
jgi:tetratricopeptide (TPR) repeat protein